MPTRKAEAQWNGDLIAGSGKVKLGSGAFEGNYSFKSRMEEGIGTNPEELLGAAHAACFSMAFAFALSSAGFAVDHVKTNAEVKFDKVGDGFAITGIHLISEGAVAGIDDAKFQEIAGSAKAGCPISKALAGTPITLDATLLTA